MWQSVTISNTFFILSICFCYIMLNVDPDRLYMQKKRYKRCKKECVLMIVFGSFLDSFVIVFGSFLGRFWIVLGSFLNRSWVVYGSFSPKLLGTLDSQEVTFTFPLRNKLSRG